MSDSSNQTAEETISIQNAGESVLVRMLGATEVSVHIRGEATAEYQVDARLNRSDWIENVGSEYTGSANYDDVVTTAMPMIRVRCSSGSGADDEATITLSAGGG